MGLATFRIRKENEAAKNTANKEIKKATKAAKRSAKSSK